MNRFIPPRRTIMTPGPVEADPRVLQAMSSPIVGQFDPAFTDLMNETMTLTRRLFHSDNHWAFPIDGTSRSGMEAVMVSLIEPGDRVLIPIYGRFGWLLTEIADRCGAEIITMETEWGSVFAPEDVIARIEEEQPKITAIVHGETSTGCLQPLEEIGRAVRSQGGLFLVDAVATIGGVAFHMDDWHVDAVVGGTQKCISGPSGSAPVCYNDRVERTLAPRRQVERGIRAEGDEDAASAPIRSNYFDLTQLQDYWSPRRLNHHTEATSMLYALYESLRVVHEEGLEARWDRHLLHERAIVEGIRAMGLDLYNDHANKLPVVTCILVPDGVEETPVRQMMLEEFGVEIAASFGPLQGLIWRIGAMGYSARKENVYHVLFAFEAALMAHGASIHPGAAVQAARRVYEDARTAAAAPS
ncbi:pyridoxal-phosphate-dependent aminotransferase family protein [Alkalicoccus chagannorensis]|uniref:pyridoxal-phosphate-dependent aminotransferase family protein n=1 Tax=Alkalicoccus chagannorensis TaxID=427072 RepID=UPI000428FC71|nr:alanine--glyoxylate aminotransferase family protein [Alkalicoccus chagannorensis]